MNALQTFLDTLAKNLLAVRFEFNDEAELQEQIQKMLAADPRWHREYKLTEGERPDFFCPAMGVVIEVKITSSVVPILRQVARYAKCDAVVAVVLVSVRPMTMPAVFGGKILRNVALWANSL